MTLETLVQDYGYPALFVGTFLEGETILVLGGLAAHLGYLDLGWVIAAGFAGTFCGDQLYYFLGRRHGTALLERKPGWQVRADRIFDLLQRHQLLLILGFRFLYGLRTVTPFLIGTSGIRPLTFLVLNSAGGAIWAATVVALGYLFGRAVETVIGDIKHYELEIVGIVVLGGVAMWLTGRYRHRRKPGSSP